jgi:AraC-like DNA-binding protein
MNALIPAVELLKASSEQPLRCALDMNTSSVLPAEQFDFFRSWYAGIAEVTLFQEECSSFLAHQMVWDFGKLTFIYLTLPYCQFGWRHLSRPTIDNWYLTLLLPKAQDSRGDFEAGDLGLHSFADPFEYISKKTDFLAFVLPRNLHFIQSSTIEIRRNSKQLLTDYMLLLHRSLPHLRSTDALNIAAATTSLLAACLAPSRDRIAEAQRPIEAVLMNRASQIIAKRLSDPKLTPDLLCREIGVSRSGLYRIFESVGGVANYIRRARLCKTRDALADSSDGRSIFTIAEQYGFMDPSTYSRMFKKEFGISPRDARTEGWLNLKFARPTDRTPTLRNLLLGNYWDRSNDVDRL